MDILGILGSAPGPLVATISHGGKIRTVRLTVARHPDGGWCVAQPGGGRGARCHAVPAAVLLEAGEILAQEPTLLAA